MVKLVALTKYPSEMTTPTDEHLAPGSAGFSAAAIGLQTQKRAMKAISVDKMLSAMTTKI